MSRGVSVRDEYAPRFGRQVLTLWTGPFAEELIGNARELPGHDGYMITLTDGRRVRVECESPRTDENYARVDARIETELGWLETGRVS